MPRSGRLRQRGYRVDLQLTRGGRVVGFLSQDPRHVHCGRLWVSYNENIVVAVAYPWYVRPERLWRKDNFDVTVAITPAHRIAARANSDSGEVESDTERICLPNDRLDNLLVAGIISVTEAECLAFVEGDDELGLGNEAI
jgi:hypothetical protein